MATKNAILIPSIVLLVGIGTWGSDDPNLNPGDGAGPMSAERVTVDELLAVMRNPPSGLGLERLAATLAGPRTSTTLLHVSVESGGANEMTVAPGETVDYQVVGALSDDANQGLALFGFDLVFDGGDLPPADKPLGEPTPGCDNPMANFTIPWGINNPEEPCPPACGFGGTIIGGDLIQLGGGQNTINNTPDNAPFPIGPVLTGVAQPSGCGPAVLVTGSLVAPDETGDYTLSLVELFANVIIEDTTGDPFWETATAGAGTIADLSISVSSEPGIPTVSTWGVVVMALLLLTAYKLCFRRRVAGGQQA
jgi:hypothetical protein